MHRFSVALAAVVLLLPSLGAEQLTLDAIFARQSLTGPEPTQLHWSPDGERLAYILGRENSRERDLWIVDARTGEKSLALDYDDLSSLAPSVEEAASDERERERLRRYSVAGYLWSPDSESLLFASSGRLYLWSLTSGKQRALAPGKTGARNPKFSPDGRSVAFVHQHDLWLAPVSGGPARRLTRGGSDVLLHGEPDWVYQEEFAVRTGYHWSPDSRRIVFLEIDQRSVPRYPILTLTATHATTDLQRYPQPGDPNPRLRVGVIEVGRKKPKPRWFAFASEYLPRVGWIDDESLWVQTLNRGQDGLRLVSVDVRAGKRRVLLTERDEHWINISNDVRFLGPETGFLWTSERSGFRHIYLYGYDGELDKRLTSGDWEVKKIEAVDEAQGLVYFSANRGNVLGSDLFSVALTGDGPTAHTSGGGTHTVSMNRRGVAFLDSHSGISDPGSRAIVHLPSSGRHVIHRRNALDEFDFVEPSLKLIESEDGAVIRLQILEPPGREPGKRYPLLLYVYGGPHAPTIRDAWSSRRGLFHQWLVRRGYVVAQVDDRASSIPGHRYETALDRNYGPVALADQLRAVEHLKSLDFVDPERIGIWGWSGGGFATCFALTHSDVFRVGVAGAAVTDWRLYDSIYTERYMGLPSEEAEAYRRTSCVEAAAGLEGRLLLVHGTADDNVHPQNAMQLIDALIDAGKPYNLLLYPGKTHGVSGETAQRHLYRSIADFLDLHLKGSH